MTVKISRKSAFRARTAAVLVTLGICAGAALPALARDVIPNSVTVSLLRQNDGAGAPFLRLSTPAAINGCFKVGPLNTSTDVEPPFLSVHVTHYSVDPDTSRTRAGAPCSGAMHFATADIPLDQTMIDGQKITTVRFTLDNGAANDLYDLKSSQDKIEILPQGPVRVFKPGLLPSGGQTAARHWNYPANTLVLTAPVAPAEQRDRIITEAARSAGLTPLDSVLPGFVMPSGQDHRRYYVDSDAKYTPRLAASGDTLIGGMVYARRPGTQE